MRSIAPCIVGLTLAVNLCNCGQPVKLLCFSLDIPSSSSVYLLTTKKYHYN